MAEELEVVDPEQPREPAPYQPPDQRVRAAWERLMDRYFVAPEPLEPGIARRLAATEPRRFAELGAANAPISTLLDPTGVGCIAIDLNPPPDRFPTTVQADLRAIPLAEGSVDAASAINCLYFLGDPVVSLREASRVVKPGGTFVAGAPSRYHDPELREVLPGWGVSSPFDAEEAEVIMSTVFEVDEVEWWELPAYLLPDRQAVTDYLIAFKTPDAEDRAGDVPTPTHVTKSGATVWARRR